MIPFPVPRVIDSGFTAGGAGGVVVLTLDQAPADGNVLAIASIVDSSQFVNSIAPQAGSASFAMAASFPLGSGTTIEIWVGTSLSGVGTNLDVTLSGAVTQSRFGFLELTGVDNSVPTEDTDSTFIASGTDIASGPVTVTANSLLFAVWHVASESILSDNPTGGSWYHLIPPSDIAVAVDASEKVAGAYTGSVQASASVSGAAVCVVGMKSSTPVLPPDKPNVNLSNGDILSI